MWRKLLLALVVAAAVAVPLAGTQASFDGTEQLSVEIGTPPVPAPPPEQVDRSGWTPTAPVTTQRGTAGHDETLALEPDCLGAAITINGTEGNDTIRGTASADVIHGQAGNDRIIGLGGNDIICGGAGDDFLECGDFPVGCNDGGDGNDVLSGGQGQDHLGGAPGDDTIDGGPGADCLYYYNAPGPVTLSFATGTASGEGSDTLTGIELAMGSRFDDTLIAGPSGNWLGGWAGNDALVGGDSRDLAGYWWAPGPVTADLTTGTASGEGNDTLRNIEELHGSYGYDDLLVGNGGDNGLGGLGGNDILLGRGGNDTLLGHEGNDSLAGGDGQDRAAYWNAPGPVTADLTSGTATGEGNDTLTDIENLSGSGNYGDHLVGNDSANILEGLGGDDRLEGRGGNDHLYGHEDNDNLDGGAGTDYLDGGPETDTCVNGETLVSCEDVPPTRYNVVLFIQGISSESHCDDGPDENYNRISWLKDFLTSPSRAAESGLRQADFLYYDYTSGDNSPAPCAAKSIPDYGSGDACWSLDDSYMFQFSPKPLKGQGRRLAEYLHEYLQDNWYAQITMIGHSQGGVIAAYAVTSDFNDVLTDSDRAKINAIVTLDSPLGGVPELGADAYHLLWPACPAQAEYDSGPDMAHTSQLTARLHNPPYPSVPPNTDSHVPLYTVDGNPGCVGVAIGSICLGVVVANDEHSQASEWERDHLRVDAPDHGDVWSGWDGNDRREAERQTLGRFVHCAIVQAEKPQDCSDYAGRQVFVPQPPQPGPTPQPVNVGGSSAKLRTLATWSGSTVSTTLVSPTGRVIDASTVAEDVIHFADPTSEGFEILSPEPGVWTAQLFGVDVPPDGETVVFGATTVPQPSSDADADLVADDVDNCLGTFNPSQYDNDTDGAGDECDDDDDNDGVLDALDNCQFAANAGQEDADANGLGDACDPEGVNDSDADGTVDNVDNCPLDANAGQDNADGDAWGDACDDDDDADGCADGEELSMTFDPLAWYDVYDVPVPANPDPTPNGPKNQAINFGDVLAVLFYVPTCDNCDPNANGVDYDSHKNGDTVEDGLSYDRSPGVEPNPPWEVGPPDGAINISDVLAVLAQVGLSCAGPP